MDQPDPVNGVWSGAEAVTPAAAAAAADAARERQSHLRHELRAPLAVIYPLLSLLLDDGAGELTGRQREYLTVLDRNVARLEALIAGVAASGWADCSVAPPAPDVVVLGDVAEELVALRVAEGAEGAGVLVDAGPPPGPRAWADREDVRHILAGLVRNAVAYAPESAAVTVRVRAGEGGTAELQIADTGPGIPPEELPRVFEFGFRGDLARTLKVPGLGAGLWVCRELARRNGGQVLLESVPGSGVTATVTLPAAPPEAADGPHEEQA
jgi:signal transduction histidine kinase